MKIIYTTSPLPKETFVEDLLEWLQEVRTYTIVEVPQKEGIGILCWDNQGHMIFDRKCHRIRFLQQNWVNAEYFKTKEMFLDYIKKGRL